MCLCVIRKFYVFLQTENKDFGRMTNADFWKQIDSIISGGFTSEGLQMLDHYAELFINGRLVYKRR